MRSGKDLPAAQCIPLRSSNQPWYRRVGVDVPVSPETVNAICMTAGMSGGFYFLSPSHITLSQYVRRLAGLGVDRDFEILTPGGFRTPRQQFRYWRWMHLLARWHMHGGINAAGWVIGNANLAFYSYNLPEFHWPVYRDLQLLAQRFDHYRNFSGLMLGADNAGYVPYWNWAPPIPNRPWGRAFINFQGQRPIRIPVGPGLTPRALGRELSMVATPTNEAAFLSYIHRYNRTWDQYGFFAEALKQVDPRLIFTTGSFGSAAGVGGARRISLGEYPFDHGTPYADINGLQLE